MMKKQPGGLLQRQIRPERVLALGFLFLIILGTILLCLPISTLTGKPLSVFDGLFTATSAVCVTGLVAVDTGTTFSLFGQVILLLLIQVGGLGFMVFATLIMAMLGRRLSLKDRMLIRESMNSTTLSGLVQLTEIYGLLALGIELFGAALFSIRFVPMYGWAKGLWFGLFHAISAFCNAGFDLFGGFSSLTGFWNDPLVLLTASLMIILGGIGFSLIFEVIRKRADWPDLTLHTRLVLIATATLLAAGTIFYALIEWDNPATLAIPDSNVGTKLLGAFFQSVTMRTAGFNSVDLGSMHSASKLFSSILMFIGASPASTGGGVKTTTVTVLTLLVWSVVSGQNDVTIMKKRLPGDLLRRALSIVVISLLVLLTTTVIVAVAEKDRYPFIDLLFEMSSAVATVGVSATGTPNLSIVSRALIIPVMYFGRVGPLTLALALANKMNNTSNRVKYPEEKVMIG